MAIDESKLNEFLGKAVGDLGAALSATLVLVGDRLGLYKELARGAVTSAELAQRDRVGGTEFVGKQCRRIAGRRCAGHFGKRRSRRVVSELWRNVL